MRLRFHAAAEKELWDAIDWYENQRERLGVELLEAVDAAMVRIAADPMAPSLYEALTNGPPVRRVLVKRFPYALIYDVRDEGILVLAVAHTARRSDFWLSRY